MNPGDAPGNPEEMSTSSRLARHHRLAARWDGEAKEAMQANKPWLASACRQAAWNHRREAHIIRRQINTGRIAP